MIPKIEEFIFFCTKQRISVSVNVVWSLSGFNTHTHTGACTATNTSSSSSSGYNYLVIQSELAVISTAVPP